MLWTLFHPLFYSFLFALLQEIKSLSLIERVVLSKKCIILLVVYCGPWLKCPSQSSVVGVFKKWYHSCIQKVLFTKNQLQKMFSMIEMYPDDKSSWWNSVISINWWDGHSYVSSTVIPKIVSSESFNLCVNTAPVILLHSMVCNKYQV